ncbi:MAG: UvrB/UvrC motif-containing protein [bacterium]
MVNLDISGILEGWDYKPDEISVRKIKGQDGKEKIQLRLDLGLLQMEMEGRPDGKRPFGKESLLDYYASLVEEHIAKYGTDKNFRLDSEDCAKLRQEGVQYYHRYLSLFQLEEYDGVERDTRRNIRLCDFLKKYAANEMDVLSMEQYRPYIVMMNARARAMISLRKKDYENAIREVENGIEIIKKFFKEYNQEHLADSCGEVEILRRVAESIREKMPSNPKEELEKQLKVAIEQENYERAAKIRDQLRRLDSGDRE